jgi:hypothetical protein
MQVECAYCDRTLTFAGERPSFCAYCGKRLNHDVGLPSENDGHEAATLMPPPSRAELGIDDTPSSIGGYRLVRPIGTGGMGAVYEAEDMVSGRRVALKLISSEYATSPEAVDRFRQEGRLASMIAHPRCVFVLAADEEAGRPYIVMELMSGSTLHELVKQKGPLVVEDAVAKILDVIDGLQEAHRLGVIHRDVKPSNCFLEPGGRVKIGDFGLSKSLVRDHHLTKTGDFMGTPLFASPEQVRSDRVNEQTDVYSVAATLYFLLTGQPPFQTGDAAATVARIVIDPVPSMRTLRPEIPAALDRIVLRGLEKDRKRRWSDLEQLREALAIFLPQETSIGSIGLRLGAFLADWLVTATPFALLDQGLSEIGTAWQVALDFASATLFVLYFGLLEGLWGCSLGKRACRLRVCKLRTRESAGFGPASLRALVLFAVVLLPSYVVYRLDLIRESEGDMWLGYLLKGVGALIVAATMRRHSGYRGLHELLSGTRTVSLPWQRQNRKLKIETHFFKVAPPVGLPERLGSYVVQGVLQANGPAKILIAEDTALERGVWISLRRGSAPEIDVGRCQINRATRLRWLSCGRHEDFQWDAFLAPVGCPLPEVIENSGRLTWADAHVILEHLADELAASCRDRSLPEPLTPNKVWVQSTGQVQLVDFSPLAADETQPSRPAGSAQAAAITFLARAAIFMLEGEPRTDEKKRISIRAPLPRFALPCLDRLVGVGPERYASIEDVQADLRSIRDNPPEVTSSHRGTHLSLLSLALIVPIMVLFLAPAVLLLLLRIHTLDRFSDQVVEGERRLNELHGESLISLFQLDPIGGVVQISSDAGTLAAFNSKIAEYRTLERKAQQTSGWLVTKLRPYGVITQHILYREVGELGDIRNDVKTALGMGVPVVISGRISSSRDPTDHFLFPFIWIAEFLLGWLVFRAFWAFMWRGGVTLRMAGVTLLRANGLNVRRLQCSFRAFLVWAPVVALLLMWACLALWRYSHWAIGATDDLRWAGWLSWLCWGLGLALLPAYIGMALRSPSRTILDRLSGSYAMPR